jgi:hypothetical protein
MMDQEESKPRKDYGYTAINCKDGTKEKFLKTMPKILRTDDEAIDYLIEIFRFLDKNNIIKIDPKSISLSGEISTKVILKAFEEQYKYNGSKVSIE